MSAIAGILSDLINTLFGLYATIVLLRFIFQWVKADFYNPISQGIVRMTSPVLVPLRRVIPGLWGMDMAALLLAMGINIIALALVMLVHGYNPLGDIAGILAVAFLRLLTGIMNIFSFSLLASIVLSWVAPMSSHPAAVLITQIAEPLMAPFRKIIPPMGGIDISPIFLFLVMGMVTKLLAAGAAAFGIMVQVVWLFVFI